MRAVLAVAAGTMTLLCVVPYIRDIRRGTTVPQRTSWFVFASLSALAAIAQLSTGLLGGGLLALGAAVGFSSIFVLSIRSGVGGSTRADVAALAFGCGGLVLWRTSHSPIVAVLAVVIAEWAAGALTVRKAMRSPATETMSTWVIDGSAGVAALLSAKRLDFNEVIYPIHHILLNGAVVTAITLGRRRRALAPTSDVTAGR